MKKYLIYMVVVFLTVIISVPALAAGTVKDTKKETVELKQVKEDKKLSIMAPDDGATFSEKDIAISLNYKDGDKIRLYITKDGNADPSIYKEDTELKDFGISWYEIKLDSTGKYKIKAELYKGNKLLETRTIDFSITNTNAAKDYIESATEIKVLIEPIKDTLIRENLVKDSSIKDTKIDVKK